MAEDGVSSYSWPSARLQNSWGLWQRGVTSQPGNRGGLRCYLALFQEDELRERLALLRREALELMRLLAVFHPYLTGPVLDGTAGRYAETEIGLFADSAKDVEIFLPERYFSFEHVVIRRSDQLHGPINQLG